ncbi:MAG: hypothetical protein ABI542_09985 [Gemmatimonadota bacterium]
MKIFSLAVSLSALVGCHPARGQQPREPRLLDPVVGILDALQSSDLVALGEMHGLQEEADFVLTLLRDPRSAGVINDIVVEFGNVRYQPVIDRFIGGEQLPDSLVRLVWRNTTQIFVWDAPVYERFFREVRKINEGLAPSNRYRVLLGDPPIDWSASPDSMTWEHFIGLRAANYVEVTVREVLARHRKALLVAGTSHLTHSSGWPTGEGTEVWTLERKHHARVFVVLPHVGFLRGNDQLEGQLTSWPIPSLAVIKGSWLGQLWPELIYGPQSFEENGRTVRRFEGTSLERMADAYLYLGTRASLTRSRMPEGYYRNDPIYFGEILQRYQMMFGQPLDTVRRTRRRESAYFTEPGAIQE